MPRLQQCPAAAEKIERASDGAELAGTRHADAMGQRWLPRQATSESLDLEPILVDMQRRVNFDALPSDPLVLRLELDGNRPKYLLLRRGEVSLCDHNPGYPEPLTLGGSLAALVAWWRGDASFVEAQRCGLRIEGPRHLIRAFPSWFLRYMFAGVQSATGQNSVPLRGRKSA